MLVMIEYSWYQNSIATSQSERENLIVDRANLKSFRLWMEIDNKKNSFSALFIFAFFHLACRLTNVLSLQILNPTS